jgi:hypothetical protein
MKKLSSKLFEKFEGTKLENSQMTKLRGGGEIKTTYGGGAGKDISTHGQSDCTDSSVARDSGI